MKFIPNAVSRAVGNQTVALKANSPKILFGLGIAGAIGGTVLACRATLKLHDVLDDIDAEVQGVKTDLANTKTYNKDLAYVYAKGGIEIVRLYGPAIIVGSVSVAALTGSHVQLTRRNAGLSMAYAAVTKAYDEYRLRVREEIGEERELELYTGVYTEEIIGEDGKKKTVSLVKPGQSSPYAVFFDSNNPNWKHNQEYNRIFLQAQQSYANHLLNSRGHVFLNEIYDNLGFDHTVAGAVVGWVMGNGDNFIDFGIYDVSNADTIEFGENADLLLDFNVDGEVYKLIG